MKSTEVKNKEINPKNTFLFSDPHFDHKNIIRYCHRPFKNVKQMNDTILKNYNKKVRKDSIVYFLGDMTGPKTHNVANFWYGYWLKQLKGHIIRIKGNHDIKGYNETVIHIGELYFKLVHDPRYAGDWKGWLIHGHVHDKSPLIDFQHSKINVSVDATSFKPIKLSDIIKKIK